MNTYASAQLKTNTSLAIYMMVLADERDFLLKTSLVFFFVGFIYCDRYKAFTPYITLHICDNTVFPRQFLVFISPQCKQLGDFCTLPFFSFQIQRIFPLTGKHFYTYFLVWLVFFYMCVCVNFIKIYVQNRHHLIRWVWFCFNALFWNSRKTVSLALVFWQYFDQSIPITRETIQTKEMWNTLTHSHQAQGNVLKHSDLTGMWYILLWTTWRRWRQ